MVAALLLSACVTINVYFPAAEAKEAAKVFVEKVINDAEAPKSDGGGMAYEAPRQGFRLAAFDPLMLLGISPAHAQSPDFNIQTPAIAAIQGRMEQRFDSQLRPHFDSGALGFTEDGLVVASAAAMPPIKISRRPVSLRQKIKAAAFKLFV